MNSAARATTSRALVLPRVAAPEGGEAVGSAAGMGAIVGAMVGAAAGADLVTSWPRMTPAGNSSLCTLT